MKSDLWQELKPHEISVERLFGCSVEALSRFRLSEIHSLTHTQLQLQTGSCGVLIWVTQARKKYWGDVIWIYSSSQD